MGLPSENLDGKLWRKWTFWTWIQNREQITGFFSEILDNNNCCSKLNGCFLVRDLFRRQTFWAGKNCLKRRNKIGIVGYSNLTIFSWKQQVNRGKCELRRWKREKNEVTISNAKKKKKNSIRKCETFRLRVNTSVVHSFHLSGIGWAGARKGLKHFTTYFIRIVVSLGNFSLLIIENVRECVCSSSFIVSLLCVFFLCLSAFLLLPECDQCCYVHNKQIKSRFRIKPKWSTVE